MAKPTRPFSFPAFKPIDGLSDTTQIENQLLNAQNILLRPVGAFKGIPKYLRLWGLGSAETIYATLVGQGLTDADNTVAMRLARQGKNFLFFYNMPNRQCRGLFYMGDDGTYTSGSYDFTASSGLVWEILARDLDDTARWYGTRIFRALYLGNGVNDNTIVQLGRTGVPGKWRKAASNAAPGAPVISLVSPATSSNVQAYWNITAPPRAGSATLTFTARSGLFPGLSGNNKIRIRIAQSNTSDALISSLTGQGTASDPYYYTLVAGTTSANSSNTSVVTYVNTDSKVISIVEASTSAPDNTANPGDFGPTDLENGSGTGTSEGYSARTVTFYARYWDPGQENYGYEGISSPISNEVIIASTANNDILVVVPVDATAEGGRFGFIRLYMQFGKAPNAQWLLINPDDPLINGISGTFTRLGSTNTVTLTGTGWTANAVVRLTTTGTLPGGLATGTDYYLRPRPDASSQFKRVGTTNAASMTGLDLVENNVIRLTTTGTLPSGLSLATSYYLRPRVVPAATFTRYLATDEITLAGTQWAENDNVQLTTTGTLPGGLNLVTNYYLRPGTAAGRWKLSTVFNGTAVTLTTNGTGTHTATWFARAALSATFIRQSVSYIDIASGGFSEGDEVQLTTTGTLPGGYSPGVTYYLVAGTGGGAGLWFLSATLGGSGVGPFENDGLGVHSITRTGQWFLALSSGGSAVAIASAGTGVHTETLVAASNQWQFATIVDGPGVTLSSDGTGVQTASQTKVTVQVGTQTPFLPAADGGLMFEDQNRPLPHTLHAYSNEQVWRAGVTDFQERIYPSKPATSDEIAPEGVSLDDLSFITILNQSDAANTNKMTALVASQNRIDCHYATGVTMFDPTDTDQRNFTVTGAGAINQTTVTVTEDQGVFILGGDLQLRSQSIEQTGAGFAAAVASSKFTALVAQNYLRSRVDLAELARRPQRSFIFPNITDQHLYMSLPALDGTLKMFAYDFLNSGIVGPFDYPKVYAAARMEPDRPEIIFADEDGNLFVWDTANQLDRGDTFGVQSAFTAFSTATPPPVQYNGYGYVDVGSNRYYQAYTSILETGFINLDGFDSRKSLVALLFRCVVGSRGFVTATVTALDGRTESLTFSQTEFYAEVEHRLNLFMGRTTAVKIKFEIIGAEQKGWIIRDVVALWTAQSKV